MARSSVPRVPRSIHEIQVHVLFIALYIKLWHFLITLVPASSVHGLQYYHTTQCILRVIGDNFFQIQIMNFKCHKTEPNHMWPHTCAFITAGSVAGHSNYALFKALLKRVVGTSFKACTFLTTPTERGEALGRSLCGGCHRPWIH